MHDGKAAACNLPQAPGRYSILSEADLVGGAEGRSGGLACGSLVPKEPMPMRRLALAFAILPVLAACAGAPMREASASGKPPTP